MTNLNQQIRTYIKNQLNQILLYSALSCDTIVPNKKISEIITFPEDVNLIRQSIKEKFDLDIHQDLLQMTPNQLYAMLFVVIHNSESRKAKILKKMEQREEKTSATMSAPIHQPHNGILWNRRKIFGYIIGNIRNTFGRPVQSTERIGALIREAYETGVDINAFTQKLKDLENFFAIKIDQEMRICDVGEAAEKSFVAQGKAVDTDTEKQSMDPLWATILPALSVNFWQNIILRDLGVRVSVYKLAHTKSYAELEAIIEEAKQRKGKQMKAKKTTLNYTEQETREIIKETIKTRLYASPEELAKTNNLYDLGANSLDIVDICTDIEKALNVNFDSRDFATIRGINELTIEWFIKILKAKYGFKQLSTNEAGRIYDQAKRDFYVARKNNSNGK